MYHVDQVKIPLGNSSKACCVQTPAPSIFSEASKTLTIVIPAYNEQSRLPSTLDETMR